jgi:hypothetical protein
VPPGGRFFLARLTCCPENGGDTFLRSVGSCRATLHYIPEEGNFHT